jgi:hypothetical protein
MAGQNNPSNYALAIQAQLTSTASPVPVYASFNRNFASQQKFICWNLRNVHQPVYTGSTQSVKGIDRPIFQVNIYAGTMQDVFSIANTIIQALHGYSGQFGGVSGFYVSKIDVDFLYNTYDNDIGLHSIFLDCTMDIPT